MKRYSILDNLDYCYFCGTPAECIHEVFFGIDRQSSIKNGFCVGLCHKHHNMSNESVHLNREMDLKLKTLYQREYEKEHTRDDFRKIISMSYL